MGFEMGSILGIPENTYRYMNEFGMNVYVLVILVVILIVYYLFFSKLVTVSVTGEKSIYAKVLEIGLWGVFIVLVILNGMQYFFNINIVASVGSLFQDNPNLELKIKEMANYDKSGDGDAQGASSSRSKTLEGRAKAGQSADGGGLQGQADDTSEGGDSTKNRNEDAVNVGNKNENKKPTEKDDKGTGIKMSGKEGVFHIPSNSFSYEDSKKVCKAYGARLATYNEIEKAYTDGADWCSYGWSDSQMVLYPTQKERWSKLQEIEGHENDCGRPGVNGGYIDNPNARFGINCYGDRPEATKEDKERMKNTVIYPKTEAEIQFEKEVEGWRKKLDKIEVAPFNPTRWTP